jgi:hypothetical protein
MSDASTCTAQSAHKEWDFTVFEGSFGQEFDTAIPCQLAFRGDTDQDTELFHEALDDRGWSDLDHEPAHHPHGNRPHYDGEVMLKDNYARVKVLVFRGGVVRLYPHDDYVPTVDELSTLIEALEVGFHAELIHDPVGGGDSG